MRARCRGVVAGVALSVGCTPASSDGARPSVAASASSASATAPAPAPGLASATASPASAFALAPAGSADSEPGLAPSGEAHRATLAHLEGDPLLSLHLATLRDHFGAGARGPFASQRVDLPGGRSAVLVVRGDESDPVVLGVDRDQLLWSKPRPVAGIVPPARHLALAARPDGGAVLFAWVASLRVVAARMWADDGNPFGDFELFTPGACDALSAAYGPGAGWVVVCTAQTSGSGATGGETRAQRQREDGTVAWPREGLVLGAAGGTGPATIVFDTPATFVVVARAAAVGADHVLAYRYDVNGDPLWAAPADLGSVPPSGGNPASVLASSRLVASVPRRGVVKVELPRGLAASGKSGARVAELRSSGDVTFGR